MSSKQSRVTDYFQSSKPASVGSAHEPPKKKGRYQLDKLAESDSFLQSTPEVSSSAPQAVSQRKRKLRKKNDSSKEVPKIVLAKRQLLFAQHVPVSSSAAVSDKSRSLLSVSPTKVDVATVKREFSDVKKLKDLKQRLAAFSGEVARLNTIAENNEVALAKKVMVPPKPHHDSPSKEKPSIIDQQEPVYEKFQHLTASLPTLNLPIHYQLLHDIFLHNDYLVSLLYNRQEIITFPKLKAGVQQILRRQYELKHLGQIRQVYPEAYVFTQVKNVPKFGERRKMVDEFELVVSPNLDTDILPCADTCSVQQMPVLHTPADVTSMKPPASPKFSASPIKCTKPASASLEAKTPDRPRLLSSPVYGRSPVRTPVKDSPRKDGAKLMTPARLTLRRDIFRFRLVERVKQAHKAFLLGLNPPVELSDQDNAQLQRWHPQFSLTEVPEIEVANLPQAPTQEKLTSAKDLLTRSCVKLPSRMQSALETIARKLPTEEAAAVDGGVSEPIPIDLPSIKGIAPALLAKIRAREAVKNQVTMLRNTDEELRQLRITRLPSMIRILRSLFDVTGVSVLPIETVVKKIVESERCWLAESDVRAHVQLMAELLPQWISYVTLPRGVFVKVMKTAALSELLDAIKKAEAGM